MLQDIIAWNLLGSFALSSLILALAPGPDNIFVLTQSALYGVRKGILVICGLCLGILCQTLCVVFGVTALITSIPFLMTLLKFAGAAYLCYLAYMAITHANSVAHIDLPSASADSGSKAVTKVEPLSNFKLVRRGLIMNVTNPKVQLFFLSFFPQFLPHDLQGTMLLLYMGLLGIIFLLATIIVFVAIAVCSGFLAAQFQSVTFNRCLNYTAAVIFIGLALYTLFVA